MNTGKKRSKLLLLLGLIVVVPLLLLYVAMDFVTYEQEVSTSNINVAVVNEDEPAEFQGEMVDLGTGVEEKLSENDQVAWRFVSESEANAGIKNGTFLMKVTLPENFSTNATTALDESPAASQIDIEMSDHNNFASHMITEQVAEKLRAEVIASVQTAYNENVFAALTELGTGISQAADGTEQLKAGTEQLNSGSQQLTSGLHELLDKSQPLVTGVDQLATGGSDLNTGVASYTDGASQINDGLDKLQAASGPLATGVTQLNDGGSQLNSGIASYTTGASQINSGLATLAGNNAALNSGTQQINDAIGQLTAGSQQLTAALSEAANNIDQQSAEGQAQIEELLAGLDALNQGVIDLNYSVNGEGSQQLVNDLVTVGGALTSMQTSLINVSGNMESLKTDLTAAGSNFTAAGDAATEVAEILADPEIAMAILKADPSAAIKLAQLKGSLTTSMNDGKTALTNAGADATNVGADLTNTATALAQTKEPMEDVQHQLETLKAAVAKLSEGTPTVVAGSKQAIATLQAGLAQVSAGLKQQGDTAETMGAIQASNTIHDGLAQVSAGLNGSGGLLPSIQAYTAGVQQAADGSNQLVANNNQLNSGASDLANGLSQLNGQVPTLTSGVNQLATGSHQLVANSDQLAAGSQALAAGLGELDAQVPTLIDGVTQLNDGADQLSAGIILEDEGMATLNEKLADGSKQVSNLNFTAANVEHFVTPVTNQTQVDNLSKPLLSVLSPLVLMMVLFIGAVLTELGFNRYSRRFQAQPRLQKIALLATAIVLQAVGILLVTMWMGVVVTHPITLLLLLVLGGSLFTLIVFAFDRWWGTLGVLGSLGLLFVQLIVSGGLLPNAMLSGLYQTIGKFLPGTYLLNGLSYALNGLATSPFINTIILLVFVALFSLPFILKRKITALNPE
ncbi:YhgE/Pip domain-containing protein [Enterococcus timonensis]|uniref:YhgE/Pip domain-containing protein n=1 Tax=Enterococcus timonensis TaxID=1852364 RepID=UPI0008D948C5|nr:YhgE/Pip domain-containing protein [Enterococcus timonensis]